MATKSAEMYSIDWILASANKKLKAKLLRSVRRFIWRVRSSSKTSSYSLVEQSQKISPIVYTPYFLMQIELL